MTENSKNEPKLTHAELIKMEISGKNRAQAGYDSILWKVRSGYAIILYGALSLIVTSIDRKVIILTPIKIAIIFSILILGFSVFIALIDYHFLKCKLRVVDANNKLMDIALQLSIGQELSDEDRIRLSQLLHNSGESLTKIDWKQWNSRSPILLYLFTAMIGVVVIQLIIFF
jgi:hypothetical protein